ncbi:hypothetical protein [uncultured Photobacterium sp.]|uniref:hypothetical protein n=1 Tax=uncultured Photobacterium sp. TaxID=173973 RepID=UPI00260A9686|nr:hypothetical protein [uncultured Photobacterium sp.]
MNFKFNIPTLIIIVCISLTFTPLFYTIEQKGMELPQCVDEPLVTTTVHFFISQDAIKNRSITDVENQLNAAIKQSNRILANSCIPMRRQLGNIKGVDFSQYTLTSINQIDSILKRIVGQPLIQQIHTKPNHFYAVMLGKNDSYFDDEFCGEADVDANDRFFIISDDADEYTVEHELGHLAWAQHLDSSWFSNLEKRLKKYTSAENQHMLKPYARGYNCAGKGTVMSYEYDILPIYSSPDILYQGEACGDMKEADNARMVRDYARELRQKVADDENRSVLGVYSSKT